MADQNFENHTQWVPIFHFVLFGVLLLSLIGSCVNLYKSIGDHQRLYSAALLVSGFFSMLIFFVCLRTFVMKVQDRAIRAEENLRHYVLTGKLLDSRLTMQQIVAVRFASDGELAGLAKQAADQKMEPKAIKQAVKNWRPDFDRA